MTNFWGSRKALFFLRYYPWGNLSYKPNEQIEYWTVIWNGLYFSSGFYYTLTWALTTSFLFQRYFHYVILHFYRRINVASILFFLKIIIFFWGFISVRAICKRGFWYKDEIDNQFKKLIPNVILASDQPDSSPISIENNILPQ